MARVSTPSMNAEQLVRAAQRHIDNAARTADAKVPEALVRDEDGLLLDAMHRLLRDRAAQTADFKLFVAKSESKFGAVEKLLRDLTAKVGDFQARLVTLESATEDHEDTTAVSNETMREVTKVLSDLAGLVRQQD